MAGDRRLEQAFDRHPRMFAGDRRVEFLARHPEFPAEDLVIEDQPGVREARFHDVGHRAHAVEVRVQRRRKASAGPVEPQCRGAGVEVDSVIGPDRVDVGDTVRIEPEPVLVDDVCAGFLGDGQDLPVDVCRIAAEHFVGEGPEAVGEQFSHQRGVATHPRRWPAPPQRPVR